MGLCFEKMISKSKGQRCLTKNEMKNEREIKMAYYKGLEVIEVSLQRFLNEISEEERETDK